MKHFIPSDLPNISSYKLKSLDSFRIFLFFLFGISTLGIFWLIIYWFQDLLFFLYKNEEDIWKSDFILFKRIDNKNILIKIQRKKCRINPFKESRYYLFFSYEGQLFYFSPRKEIFICVRNQMINYVTKKNFKEDLFKGLEKDVCFDLKQFYGKNEMKIEILPFLIKALQEFFVMVNFSQFIISVVFFLLDRKFFAFVVLLFVVITIILTTYEYIQNRSKLKEISEKEDKIFVRRNIKNEDFSGFLSTKELVIGDVVTIEPEKTFPCDMLVIQGSTLVNEALLTGESLPIIKNAYSKIKRKTTKEEIKKKENNLIKINSFIVNKKREMRRIKSVRNDLISNNNLPIIEKSFIQEKQEKNQNENKITTNNILFSGTKALFNRTDEVKAIVIGTGWNTSKGKLIGAVVFAPEEVYQYEKDFYILLFIIFGYFLSLSFFLWNFERKQNYYHILKTLPKILEFLKCSFPPSLIFIMTASVQLSSSKLAKKKIYTLKTKKIIEGGAIKSVCFDKTGTLTKLDLNLKGYIIEEKGNFENFNTNLDDLFHNTNFKVFLESMSCCHGLTFYNNKILGDPIEEAMFEKVGSNLKLDYHPLQNDLPVNVISLSEKYRRILKIYDEEFYYCINDYEFTSERKRMSVVTENSKTKKIQIFCKGAPEILKTLCKRDSIPTNYDEVLLRYSQQGFRILSIASKTIDNYVQNDNPIEFEKNMNFLGFLLFENPLKDSTASTILELQNNNFEVAMITGDNIYTAINVGYNAKILKKNDSLWIGTYAKKKISWTFVDSTNHVNNIKLEGDENNNSILSSKMILSKSNTSSLHQNIDFILNNTTSDQKIALTGTCFEKLMEKFSSENDDEYENKKKNISIKEKILEKTKIYARSSARQKELIIKQLKIKLQKKKSYVAFVGDGSNDSLALKTANVGLSIGNDEASFSASFFTSLTDIKSIKEIIIEGKVCLGNSFQNFKYFMNLNIVNCFAIYYMSLYKWDFAPFDYVTLIFYAFPFGLFMSQGKNVNRLTFIKQNPTLMNIRFLLSFFLQTVFTIFCIIFLVHYLLNLEIYKDYLEVTKLYVKKEFLFSKFYFIEVKLIFFSAASFSFVYAFVHYQGYPFKENIFKNFYFLLWVFLILIFVSLNFFPEIFLNWNSDFYRVFKRNVNLPDYNEYEKNYFVLFYIAIIFLLIIIGKVLSYTELVYLYKQKEWDDKNIENEDLRIENESRIFESKVN